MQPEDTQQPAAATPAYYPLVAVLGAATAGVAGERLAPELVASRPGAVVWMLVLATAALAAWLAAAWGGWRRCGVAALLCGVAAAGAGGHHVAWRLARQDALHLRAPLAACPVVVDVVALESPRRLPPRPADPLGGPEQGPLSKLLVQVVAVRDGRRWQAASGRARLYVPEFPALRCGDRLRICGALWRAAPAANPGEFDAAGQARAQGGLCYLRAATEDSVRVLRRGSTIHPRRWLDASRRLVSSAIWHHVPPPEAALAEALVLGRREQLDDEVVDDFFRSGTVHLLAISGLHVGIMASGVWLAGRVGLLGRRRTCLAAAGLACGYALLAGARPPVLRAAVLVTAAAAARLLARPRSLWNALAAAALLLLLCNPCQLFQTGVQLSFLAVASLACCGRVMLSGPPRDPLRRLVWHARPWPWRVARRSAAVALQMTIASAGVWLLTAPLVAWRFGLLAPVGVLLNPLLGLPLTLALMAACGVVALCWLPPAAAACGAVCGWSLQWLHSAAQWGASCPGGHWRLAPPTAAWVAAGYAVWAVWGTSRTRRRRQLATAAACLWALWGAWQLLPARSHGLTCTFLSVGHGTCVVLQTPSGKTVLYDAGRLGAPRRAARTAEACLVRQRARKIDVLILSHADIDHYNAVPRLLRQFAVGEVWVGPRMLQSDDAAVAVLRQSLRESRCRVRMMSAASAAVVDGELLWEVLHPPPKWPGGVGDNADSIVLRVSCQGRSIVLPGDVEGEGLARLLSQPGVTADVAMAPHHGSLRSRPEDFVRWCGARWLIVSGGKDADLNLPAACRLLHTARAGAVQVRIQHGQVRVRSWRSEPW